MCTQSYLQSRNGDTDVENKHLYLCFGCCGVRGRTRSEGESPALRLLHQSSLKGMVVEPWMHVWKPWELNPGETSLCRKCRTGLPISRQQRCGRGTGVLSPAKESISNNRRKPARRRFPLSLENLQARVTWMLLSKAYCKVGLLKSCSVTF